MRLAIIADASCDLPASIAQRNQLQIIPLTITSKGQQQLIKQQPEANNGFYQNHNSSDIAQAESTAPSVQQIIDFLQEQAIYQFDQLLLIAPCQRISSTLSHLRAAVATAQPAFEQLRQQAQIQTPCRIRIVESQSGYAGYGLVAYHALHLLHEKAQSVDKIKKPINDFVQQATTFVLPGRAARSYPLLSNAPFQLSWLQQQRLKLTRSIACCKIRTSKVQNLTSFKEQSAVQDFLLTIYDELTRTKLINHLINISYAGPLPELRVIPALKILQAHAQDKGGRIVYSVMSPANATQLGAGAITVAFG